MAIRESLLNTITSVASSDFVRLVTSAGESSKATVANLFKSFESGLGAKSSLTTSDYIRVVGSDNNQYKQSLSSVKTAMGVDALNSTRLRIGKTTGTGIISVNLRDTPGGTLITTVPIDAYLFVIGDAYNGSYKCFYYKPTDSQWYLGYIVTSYISIS